MSENLKILNDKSLMVIFTYAPAGLGHLRVTDALYEGLPKNVTPVLLGSQDDSVGSIHRITSTSLLGRIIMENTQRGILEDVFTFFYRRWLKNNTQMLYNQMLTLLDQRLEMAKTLVIVSTHFGLAHQIAAIKEKVEYEKKVKILLAVQVTDDSPQHIWFVEGADLIFVPSEKTRMELIRYGKAVGLKPVNFVVSPYPLNPNLFSELSQEKKMNKHLQADIDSSLPINVAVPISGAAVQLEFVSKLLSGLFHISNRFKFQVISRVTDYTKNFLSLMLTKPYVFLSVSDHQREVVKKYEEVYRQKPILLEVTKPSEQAFKALLNTNQTGGSLLLFSDPVGRQEYDNLEFLQKHKLLPSKSEHQSLWNMAKLDKKLTETETDWLNLASKWRGIILPKHSSSAARFIYWCLREKIFRSMLKYKTDKNDGQEIAGNGVEKFWEKITDYLVEQKFI